MGFEGSGLENKNSYVMASYNFVKIEIYFF
jgi:hypothetical protein